MAILFAVSAMALVFLVARPLWDEITTMRAESAVIADNLARLQEVEGLRDELLNKFNSIPKSDLERLEKFLPHKANTEDLLVTFEELTRARGIVLKNINFAPETSSSQLAPATGTGDEGNIPPSTVNYSFSIAGSYEAFRSLLDAMEKNLRLVDMNDMSFSSAEGAYSFSLRAKSYYQR